MVLVFQLNSWVENMPILCHDSISPLTSCGNSKYSIPTTQYVAQYRYIHITYNKKITHTLSENLYFIIYFIVNNIYQVS